jgi:hypothetical protein
VIRQQNPYRAQGQVKEHQGERNRQAKTIFHHNFINIIGLFHTLVKTKINPISEMGVSILKQEIRAFRTSTHAHL